ncbi:unnamed protein product [Bursaphelenchus xylophilus]|uniref:XK-related protein n=1 Tax=Bursaphelenchus xylophilus TaxID=6326 RepID=A0A1I7S427_BURXY|nr:unnamed protein product [Bursaphelenchus xylophilus]CAG9116656.1 unnamed protein product [Bursaphelenchus xylophilus]
MPGKSSFREKIARTLNLHDKSEEDECDRIPSNIIVTSFDMTCYFFAIFTYISDIFMDIFVAIFYFRKGNQMAGILTTVFILLPSLILNFISILFWMDDEARRREDDCTDRSNTYDFVFTDNIKILSKSRGKGGIEVTDSDDKAGKRKTRVYRWVLAVILQLGPLLWYCKSMKYALKCFTLQKRPRKERIFYQKVFYKKIEADRDAGILRFFEACLESMPQLLIQGYFLSKDWQNYGHTESEFIWHWRCTSIVLSLISISYSFVSHHRVLRISLPQKQNLGPLGCYLIFLWRFFTVSARFNVVTVILVINFVAGLVLMISHLLISTSSLLILQRIDTKSKSKMIDPVMFAINLWIHIFGPFNMAEGPSRLRYGIEYGLEIFEGMIVICLANFYFKPTFPFVDRILAGMGVSYAIGITIMIIYHLFFHPNIKTKVVFRNIASNKP